MAKPKRVKCPECGNDMSLLTPHQEKENENIFRMYCPKCEIRKNIDITNFNLEPKCPNWGNHVQDPRGAAYAKLTANFIGHCGGSGCEACVNNPQTSLPVF